jgi:metal-responsive CopG/Arc/MetJ family transcriptional regulator
MSNNNLVAFRCPAELLEALDRMAAEHDVARSEMIRLLIEEAT